ncbi:MAG: EutN/CcmL family microcompartment protein [Deltaproteobacteria bacterium]|nr:EutN/CcmL family microcompartment protein [Deltaproteobacteria bacterium]
MRLARVIGTVVASVQDARFDGQKLLLVQPVDEHAKPVDRTLLAVDAAQAGVGDYVLVVQEGKSARAVMGVPDAPCEAIIVGVVDHVQTGGEQRFLKPAKERT